MNYADLVKVYRELESTSKRLLKTWHLSQLLKETPEQDLKTIVLLMQGKVFPTADTSDLGIAAKLVTKAISVASGKSKDDVEQTWKKTGDLGITAEKLIDSKSQATLFTQTLTTDKVLTNLRKLSTIEGQGSVDQKIQIIAELLTSSTKDEANFIVKTILGQLRAGVGDGSIRDSIVWAYFDKDVGLEFDHDKIAINVTNREEYNSYVDAVQYAFDLLNDFSQVAYLAKTKGKQGLLDVTITIGNPIKVMLALKATNVENGIEQVGTPLEAEYKYDGFRVQIHKTGDTIKVFTRRLEEVTAQFPDIVQLAKECVSADNYILDGEAVGVNPQTKEYLPFQNISQRIKRKYDIERMVQEFPVVVHVFDILAHNNQNILTTPFKERRALIDKIVTPKDHFITAQHIITDNPQDIEKFYQQALRDGNEGVMLKALDAPYKPGGRVGYMIKLKPVMDTLDLVIVGAEWGEGKRSAWLSAFVIAAKDGDEYKVVGRVGTGFKEKDEQGLSFNQMTQLLKPLIIKEEGKEVQVKPEIVIEVDYEEIQTSPTYNSGYALRFPRVKGLRQDRNADDCSTVDQIQLYYEQQRQ